MSHLHHVLAARVDQWRGQGYPAPGHDAVAEILEWAVDGDSGTARFLRRPQLRALETYWYLRLVEKTPHVLDLYRRLFPGPADLLEAMGLGAPDIVRRVAGRSVDELWQAIRSDDDFVRAHRLESVRETLTLDYPSYILALAMGAGKTIVESLRELVVVPYDRILPPRLFRPFAASVKLTFTRDGDPDIPVIRGSLYNVVVTNTEKIRIQKGTIRKTDLGGLFARGREDEARAEVANLAAAGHRLAAAPGFSGRADAYVGHVIEDFFGTYRDVRLPDGSPARLALYFPQTDDLESLRPAIEAALVRMGQTPDICLRNTSKSSQDEIDAFNRLNDPASPHRVILLVNKGTEGWNCPSLFACALARRLQSSNNFVLQAATRCLRQVPGNAAKARIYLSRDDYAILDRQLQETYGETIAELNGARRERGARRLVLRKPRVPPIALTRVVRTVVPVERPPGRLGLARPKVGAEAVMRRAVLELAPRPGHRRLLQQVGDTVEIEAVPDVMDTYEAAVDLGARFRLDPLALREELTDVCAGDESLPLTHVEALAGQLAERTRAYEVREETVEWALALVKPAGFARERLEDGTEAWVTEITYPKDKERLLLEGRRMQDANRLGFEFHYDPYDFDSNPELEFFPMLLRELNLNPAEVEDVYFTGGLSDPAKTDFFVHYQGEDGRWHRYTPDFVIRKRPRPGAPAGGGRILVVEIKSTQFESATREDERRFRLGEPPVTAEGRKAVALRKLEQINPDRLAYELVFARVSVTHDDLASVRRFVREPERAYAADVVTARALEDVVLRAHGTRVSRVILFGSRARGDARPDSDFDLLVLLRGATRDEARAFRLELYRLFRGQDAVVEPWVMTKEEFEETKAVVGGVAHPAWTEGIPL